MKEILKIKSFVLNKLDLSFVLFMCAILNYRYSIKLIAICLIYLIRPNFKFDKSLINIFFLLMIMISIVNLIASGNYEFNHITSVFSGSIIWLFCALIFHQIKLFIEIGTTHKIINSIKLITIINLLFSLLDIIKVMTIVNSLNPYTKLSPPPYGIMSGDLIGGMFGEAHNVNTCISALLLIFFLYRKNFIYGAIALITLLMTSSNLAVIIIIIGIIIIIISIKDIITRYYSILNIAIIIIFYSQINPHNFYSTINLFSPKTSSTYFKKIDNEIFDSRDKQMIKKQVRDSISNSWESLNKEKIITEVDTLQNSKIDSAKSSPIINNVPTTNKLPQEVLLQIEKETQKKSLIKMWDYKKEHIQKRDSNLIFNNGKFQKFNIDSCPGAIISYHQTLNLLTSNWKTFLIGAGTNEFSSRLAFVNSKMSVDSRLFSIIPKYENQLFVENHKALYKFLQYEGEETHSIIHVPTSSYNQIIGEYGIIGFLGFILLYLGYFFKKYKQLSYGKYLIILIIPLFAFDYWFERMSLMVLFECIMLLDLKLFKEKENLNN